MVHNFLRAIPIILSIVMIIGGCAKTMTEKELKLSEDNISIRLEGIVYPSKRQDILSTVPGTVEHLYIKYGTKVKKGQKLYSLDKELIQLDIKNKKIEIESLIKRKQQLLSHSHAENTEEINLAAMELKKVAQLKSEGYVENFRLNQYKKNYLNALYLQETQKTGRYEKLKTIESTLLVKKNELQKLQYQLRHTEGYASIDGFVADIKIQKGQDIGIDQKVCTILNLDKVIVRAGFASGLLPFVQKSQEVEVSFITTPPYKTKAYISEIVPIINPKFQSMTMDITIPNKSYLLQEGTHALVTISLPKNDQKEVKKYFLNNKKDRVIQVQSDI